jgi:hypothetical protein
MQKTPGEARLIQKQRRLQGAESLQEASSQKLLHKSCLMQSRVIQSRFKKAGSKKCSP